MRATVPALVLSAILALACGADTGSLPAVPVPPPATPPAPAEPATPAATGGEADKPAAATASSAECCLVDGAYPSFSKDDDCPAGEKYNDELTFGKQKGAVCEEVCCTETHMFTGETHTTAQLRGDCGLSPYSNGKEVDKAQCTPEAAGKAMMDGALEAGKEDEGAEKSSGSSTTKNTGTGNLAPVQLNRPAGATRGAVNPAGRGAANPTTRGATTTTTTTTRGSTTSAPTRGATR